MQNGGTQKRKYDYLSTFIHTDHIKEMEEYFDVLENEEF